MTPHDRNARGTLAAVAGVALLPILAAYAIMARYMVNVPFIDDYPTILGFSVKYLSLASAGQRFHYILADQYVEYKLVFLHLLSAMELGLTHHVNFTLHAWLGNLALLPLLYVLWRTHLKSATSTAQRAVLFLPIVFLLFAQNYAEAVDWAASATAYLLNTTLCLAAIYLLTEQDEASRNTRAAGACLLTFAAWLLSANAYLLFPLGLWLFFKRRNYTWAAVWCALLALSAVPYAVHFVKDARPGTGPMWLIPIWFVMFLGSAALPTKAAFPVGVVVLVICGAAWKTKFWRTHPAAFWQVMWLLASAALAAVGRGRTGLAFAVVSRYQFFSNLFLIFCYGYLVERVRSSSTARPTQRRLFAAALVLTVLFCMRSDWHGIKLLQARRTLLQTGVDHFRQDPAHNSPMWFDNQEHDTFFQQYEIDARQSVVDAERMGIYRLPEAGDSH